VNHGVIRILTVLNRWIEARNHKLEIRNANRAQQINEQLWRLWRR
jgi:hypothetical protein